MRSRRRGGAIVETALMLPWLFILFICVLDFGFYAYGAICTQNAARAVAMRAAEDSSAVNANPCIAAIGEMNRLPNVSGCVNGLSVSDSQPLVASVQAQTGPDGAPSVQARVTYRSIPLFPIPGMMMGRMTLTRIAEARVNQ